MWKLGFTVGKLTTRIFSFRAWPTSLRIGTITWQGPHLPTHNTQSLMKPRCFHTSPDKPIQFRVRVSEGGKGLKCYKLYCNMFFLYLPPWSMLAKCFREVMLRRKIAGGGGRELVWSMIKVRGWCFPPQSLYGMENNDAILSNQHNSEFLFS